MTHPLDERALEAAAMAVLQSIVKRESEIVGRPVEPDEFSEMVATEDARAAVTAYLAETDDGWMPINTIPKPRNADEARAMVLLGERWLSDNAAPPAAQERAS
jgi:hypothetical protein